MNLIGTKLNALNRRFKTILVLFNDLFLAFTCWLVFGPPMATIISGQNKDNLFEVIYSQIYSFIFPAILFSFYFYFFGYYRSLIRFFDSRDSILLCVSGSLLFGFSWAAIYILQFDIIQTNFLPIILLQGLLLSAVLYAFINISRDVAKFFLYPYEKDKNATPVVIYGSGQSAQALINTLQNDSTKHVVAIFDDSSVFKNLLMNNIPIISSFKKLAELKFKHSNLQVFLAIPNMKTEQRRKIISDLETLKVAVRTVPSLSELISDQKKLGDIQELSIDDILPGARISNFSVFEATVKTFFISGAGGSIGSEITRQLLAAKPRKIILYEFSEFNLFQIERECLSIIDSKGLDTLIIPILGDIRDINNLNNVFNRFQIDHIYHAAAYKHVPLVEDENNLAIAAENNILGTYNLAQIAVKHKVDSFVMISTDKAVRPTNIMGATKRFAEIIIQSINASADNTRFCMVRFGNVINSSGSVIPLFLDQISRGGPVTVTDKNVMRYFMTIPEASSLVLQAGEMSTGGEVFILDMGEQVKIYDLAKKLIHLSGRNYLQEEGKGDDGIQILEIGLRPGEKMYEELFITESEIKTDNPKIFKANESYIQLDLLQPILTKIEESIRNFDNKKILSILTENVEGFER
ncbi:nucleoside-diphosphate sugar epimerase/dehydratase [Gammaproteobacteria bacterium]|nr:polysaccharide biosynthesis protein [Gammaproteobacteria bacterium]MDC0902668.1 nucleoside-diphosphate sugar epimerase/dehydratase [Gammaproteobacteria bacterium]